MGILNPGNSGFMEMKKGIYVDKKLSILAKIWFRLVRVRMNKAVFCWPFWAAGMPESRFQT